MMFATSTGKAIHFFRTSKGMTLEQVAAAVGIDTGNLSRIEAGKQMPRAKNLTLICEALGVSPAALQQRALNIDSWDEAFARGNFEINERGELNSDRRDDQVAAEIEKIRESEKRRVAERDAADKPAAQGVGGWVPLISNVQAGYGVAAVDNLQPGEGERIPTTYRARAHTYALRVKGDSMEPKFPEGSIIIVEPEEPPQHGKYVVIRRNGDEATLKQYVVDGPAKYLKPLNTRYPILELNAGDVFCGVVKRVEMDV